MKKNRGWIVLIVILCAAVAFGGYKFFNRNDNRTYFDEQNNEIHFANNTSKSISSAGNPDFVQASAAVIPVVVHIKTLYEGSTSRSQNPLEELFGGPRSQGRAMGSGSGVVVTTDGYIVTNNHVVQDADQIQVVFPDKRTFKGKIIGTDPSTDLAVVKVDGKDFQAVELGNSDNVQIGEWVLAVGYPFSLNSTVTAGIVSAKGRSIGILDQPTQNVPGGGNTAIESFIQTDAAINPGNSGGALVNTAGQLIGINAAIASMTGSYAGYGFAIPINLAKKIMNDFIKYGEVKRGYLGISFPAPAVEDRLLAQQGIKPGSVKGVYVTEVQSNSAAAEAGLKEGDIIQGIDGTQVTSSSEFSERIARRRPGDKVQLSYLRNGKTATANVTLKDRPSTTLSARNRSNADEELHNKLGASFAPLSRDLKQKLGLNSGIVITEVQDGSFFEQADLPRGTIITTVNGRPVNNVEELNLALGLSSNGMARIVGITPNGTSFIFNFPLGA
jgi:serine protease Do